MTRVWYTEICLEETGGKERKQGGGMAVVARVEQEGSGQGHVLGRESGVLSVRRAARYEQGTAMLMGISG